jgi:hypothetical protein
LLLLKHLLIKIFGGRLERCAPCPAMTWALGGLLFDILLIAVAED